MALPRNVDGFSFSASVGTGLSVLIPGAAGETETVISKGTRVFAKVRF